MAVWQFPTPPDEEGFYTLFHDGRTIRLRPGHIEEYTTQGVPRTWYVYHLNHKYTRNGVEWTDLISIGFHSKIRAERISRYFEENPGRALLTLADENAFLTEEFPETEEEITEREINQREIERHTKGRSVGLTNIINSLKLPSVR
jgi:hypothetical protein